MNVYRHIVESSGGTVLIATWDKECITNFAIDTSSTSMIQSTGTTSTGTTSGATVTVNSSSVSRFCTLPISFKINGTDTCNDNSVIIEQKNPCSCDSLTVNGTLEPCSCNSMTPSGTEESETNYSVYASTSDITSVNYTVWYLVNETAKSITLSDIAKSTGATNLAYDFDTNSYVLGEKTCNGSTPTKINIEYYTANSTSWIKRTATTISTTDMFYLVGVNNKSNPTSFIVSDGFTFDALTLNGNYDTTINVKESQPTINVSATNNANKHVWIHGIVLEYRLLDNLDITSVEFELAPGNTSVQRGVEIPQDYDGVTIINIKVTYSVDGDEYQRLLQSDEWWCTSGKELRYGDTLYIQINSI